MKAPGTPALRRVPQRVYEAVYCQRAHIENRIKELHYELATDRTSCTSFWSNQMRVMLTAAAYVPMQEVGLRAAGTSCARTQVTTLRERLFKLSPRLERSVRRDLNVADGLQRVGGKWTDNLPVVR